ncbi:IclR family transcriptional regulator [Chelativorans sp. M5D2P16]|uniref:IclR family transcriptional regulator n=1 Tax=Chelativorans sp. M5D2P16 TaxID=3095678 RepID=UPI002ACADAC3|nr:IclR family transcriptional regulator [Chelativorans sp. M5D2P16]MDZ5698304.1 IclR family transcriptional regulator [Chelativorans sp. M5D2P16]
MSSAADNNKNASTRPSNYGETRLSLEERGAAPRLIQSVERALLLLETLAEHDGPLLLNELARNANLNVSTCHHLLATLVARGYVLHGGRNRGYMLSSKLRELAEMADREVDILDFVRADLEKLNANLRESVQMAVLRGSALVTQVRYGSMMPTHVEPDEIKKMRAAHATATGKAILAWLPEAEMARVVSDNGLTAFTPNTITTLSGLIEELRLVRRSGFAIDEEELEENVICYGAALRDGAGAVIGSISCSIPKSRATPDYRTHIARSVVRCAQDLSDRLRVGR